MGKRIDYLVKIYYKNGDVVLIPHFIIGEDREIDKMEVYYRNVRRKFKKFMEEK